MHLAIFTDEIHKEDFTRALDRAVAWGVSHVEVRAIDGVRLPKVSGDVLDRFVQGVRDRGLRISGFSPGFFKCDLHDPDVQKTFDHTLPRLCDLAGQWEAELITCFSFKRRDGEVMPSAVIDRLGQAAEIVQSYQGRLVLENVAACWGATGQEAGEIIRQVGYDRIGLCWDPGNAARGGADVPFPDDYVYIKDLVDHVHVKNFVPIRQDWGLVPDGVVDWPAQVQALSNNGFDGLLVVETHLTQRPPNATLPPNGFTALEANSYDNVMATRACLKKVSTAVQSAS